jgi:hypothetical protein
MEERKAQIQKVREQEKSILNQIETLIRDKYKKELFLKYKFTIKNIAECYKNQNLDFEQAQLCSSEYEQSYKKSEEKFESLMKHYGVFFRGKPAKFSSTNLILFEGRPIRLHFGLSERP